MGEKNNKQNFSQGKNVLIWFEFGLSKYPQGCLAGCAFCLNPISLCRFSGGVRRRGGQHLCFPEEAAERNTGLY